MLESRTEQSIFKIMEEELVMKGKSDEALLNKLTQRLSHFPSYKKSKFGHLKHFTVVHYAGEVNYDVKEFLSKNMDHASDSVI